MILPMINIIEIVNLINPQVHLSELYQKGELVKFLPELVELHTNDKGHKNNFIHTLDVLHNVCNITDDYKMKLVAVFHDIGKIKTRQFNKNGEWTFHNHESVSADMTLSIFDRLNIHDQELRNYVYRMIYFHGRIKIHKDVTESAIRRLDKEVGQDIIFDLIEFCKCDITTKFEYKKEKIITILNTIKDRIVEVRFKDSELEWKSPLTGNIIMDILNIKPCKLIGDIKKELDPKLKSGEITLEESIQILNTYKKGK